MVNGRPYLSPLLLACGLIEMEAKLIGKPIETEPLDSIAVPDGRVYLLPVVNATGQPGNDFELLTKIEKQPNFRSGVLHGAALAQSVATGESGLKAALLASPEFVKKLAPVNPLIFTVQESAEMGDDLPATQVPQPVAPKPRKGL